MKRKNVIWCVAGIVMAATAVVAGKEIVLGAEGAGGVVTGLLLAAALIAAEALAAVSIAHLLCGECWCRFDTVAHVVFACASLFGALLLLEMLLGSDAPFLQSTVGRLREIDAVVAVRFFLGVVAARLLYVIAIPFRLAWEDCKEAEAAEESWA